MTKLEPFGTIKACPACGAKETWGDNYTLGMNVYPVREFEREYRQTTMSYAEDGELEEFGYIISTCWRCGYAWRESALWCVEENDEDQANQQ